MVSSVRNDWKLSAIPLDVLLLELEELELELDDDVAGAEVGIGAVVASTAMVVSSNPDVDAAARSERAAIGASRDLCRYGVFVGNDDALRITARAVVVVLSR